MEQTPYDVAVIGGGVNGCGIARDAAGRGARVLLLEAGDLARGTSSASSKLIHGGLRYLEHYEFGLVREALTERERLWAIAPHIIWPMRFILPHVKGLRPRWMLRAGLFLYDMLGKRERLPGAKAIRLADHVAGKPLKPEFTHGFAYSDCWVDDARLVVLNARDAADHGAEVHTRCPVQSLRNADGLWRIETPQGAFQARAVINAAGPSVLDLLAKSGQNPAERMRLVRGSHIVVPRLFDHDHPYFFQLPDGRIFFAIPYEDDFTLIGTTDRDHEGPLDDVRASEEEIAYLCDGASRFFTQPVRPADVVWSYAGVRPLVDDGSGKPEAATRGYRLVFADAAEQPPFLSIFGGKITTYRQLAEDAVDLLNNRLPLPHPASWTADRPLPGGDVALDDLAQAKADFARRAAFLPPDTIARLWRCHGTQAAGILGAAQSLAECGEDFGHGLYEGEVRHFMAREWARSADDILWRRTKLGLRFSPAEKDRLEAFIARVG